MKSGVNLDTEKVYIEVSSNGGINTNVEMDPKAARILAAQLVASAGTVETYI